MSYIDLINRFWRLNSELPFSAFDTRFYFYLLSIANERGWQPNFMVPTRQLEFALGRSRKDIIAARQRLAARGLISFEKGSRGVTPIYTVSYYLENASPKTPCSGDRKSTDSNTVSSRKKSPKVNTCEGVPCPSAEASQIAECKEVAEEDAKEVSINADSDGTQSYSQNVLNSDAGCNEIVLEPDTQTNTVYKNKTKIKTKTKTKRERGSVADDALSPSPSRLLDFFEEIAVSEKYRNFCKWYRENAPVLSRTLRPMSEEEFKGLCADFGSEAVADNIIKLENRNDLRGRYSALHPTLVNWCSRDLLK